MLTILPVVEGVGDVHSIPILLRRLADEELGGRSINVLSPIRQPRGKLLSEVGEPRDGLTRAVELARLKLSTCPEPRVVLVLLDSERACPRVLAPRISEHLGPSPTGMPQVVVLAHVMFETWFVAAADSLTQYLEFDVAPADPEGEQHGKSWIKNHFRGAAYGETVDQPRMTAQMDLKVCRSKSPSFDKLCREVNAQLDRLNQ